jgi:hypothetical protein
LADGSHVSWLIRASLGSMRGLLMRQKT